MSSEIEFLVKLRDAAAMIMDSCEGRLEALAPAEMKTSVPEETFLNLKYEEQNSEKLGIFQTADTKTERCTTVRSGLFHFESKRVHYQQKVSWTRLC